jgi:RHS repeat-associated protein
VRATPNAKPGPVRRPRQRHSATLAGCASGTVPQFEWTKSRGPVSNQTGAGGRTFAYDVANRLSSTTTGSTTDAYAYDGDSNRLTDSVGSNTTKYLWDSNWPLPQLVLERDGSNSLLRRYTYGAGIGPLSMATVAGSFYYHYDPLGSVANLTNASGATQWTYSYEPYGSPVVTTNAGGAPANPIRFTGQYLDSTGLYNLRARQYDPTSGRFLETDPSPAPASMPYTGTYAYAGDDPSLGIDPSGQTCWGCILPALGDGLAADFKFVTHGGATAVKGAAAAADLFTLVVTIPFTVGGDDSSAQRSKMAQQAKGHQKGENRDIKKAARDAGLNPEGRRVLGREVEAEKRASDQLGGNARLPYKDIQNLANDLAQNPRWRKKTG